MDLAHMSRYWTSYRASKTFRLKIHIYEAHLGLAQGREAQGDAAGAWDTIASVYLPNDPDGQRQDTIRARKSRNPVWDQSVVFDDIDFSEHVRLEVRGMRKLGENPVLASLDFEVHDVMGLDPRDDTSVFQLNCDRARVRYGVILLAFEFDPPVPADVLVALNDSNTPECWDGDCDVPADVEVDHPVYMNVSGNFACLLLDDDEPQNTSFPWREPDFAAASAAAADGGNIDLPSPMAHNTRRASSFRAPSRFELLHTACRLELPPTTSSDHNNNNNNNNSNNNIDQSMYDWFLRRSQNRRTSALGPNFARQLSLSMGHRSGGITGHGMETNGLGVAFLSESNSGLRFNDGGGGSGGNNLSLSLPQSVVWSKRSGGNNVEPRENTTWKGRKVKASRRRFSSAESTKGSASRRNSDDVRLGSSRGRVAAATPITEAMALLLAAPSKQNPTGTTKQDQPAAKTLLEKPAKQSGDRRRFKSRKTKQWGASHNASNDSSKQQEQQHAEVSPKPNKPRSWTPSILRSPVLNRTNNSSAPTSIRRRVRGRSMLRTPPPPPDKDNPGDADNNKSASPATGYNSNSSQQPNTATMGGGDKANTTPGKSRSWTAGILRSPTMSRNPISRASVRNSGGRYEGTARHGPVEGSTQLEAEGAGEEIASRVRASSSNNSPSASMTSSPVGRVAWPCVLGGEQQQQKQQQLVSDAAMPAVPDALFPAERELQPLQSLFAFKSRLEISAAFNSPLESPLTAHETFSFQP